jgi:hypothetical protein
MVQLKFTSHNLLLQSQSTYGNPSIVVGYPWIFLFSLLWVCYISNVRQKHKRLGNH